MLFGQEFASYKMYQVCFAVFCALAIIQSVLSIGTRVYYAHKVADSLQRHTSSASIRVNPELAEFDGVELDGDAIGDKPEEGLEEVDTAFSKVGEWQSALNWEFRKVDREIKGYGLHIVGLLLEGACGNYHPAGPREFHATVLQICQ